jgi:hypothetical protein
MLGTLLSPFLKKRSQKNFLLSLLNEINSNLEKYYVIDQRQFITMDFEMSAWEEARHFSGSQFPGEVLDYASALEDFNRTFADCRALEETYSSSIDNKTLEAAKVLHAKKEAVEEKFRSVQPKIIAAQKALRVRMDKKF